MLTVRRLLVAATSLAISSAWCSSASAIDWITELPKPEEVRRATLAFHGLNVDTYVPVTELTLFQNGCVYASKPGSDEHLELLAILRDGLALSDRGPHRFRLRTAIHLHLTDGSVFSLSISDAHHRTPGVVGTVDDERRDAQGFLSSDEALPIALRTWARKRLEPRNRSSFCHEPLSPLRPPTGS